MRASGNKALRAASAEAEGMAKDTDDAEPAHPSAMKGAPKAPGDPSLLKAMEGFVERFMRRGAGEPLPTTAILRGKPDLTRPAEPRESAYASVNAMAPLQELGLSVAVGLLNKFPADSHRFI